MSSNCDSNWKTGTSLESNQRMCKILSKCHKINIKVWYYNEGTCQNGVGSRIT